jgi:hypothetical protein
MPVPATPPFEPAILSSGFSPKRKPPRPTNARRLLTFDARNISERIRLADIRHGPLVAEGPSLRKAGLSVYLTAQERELVPTGQRLNPQAVRPLSCCKPTAEPHKHKLVFGRNT